jgi:hypothetical protein
MKNDEKHEQCPMDLLPRLIDIVSDQNKVIRELLVEFKELVRDLKSELHGRSETDKTTNSN